MAKNDLQTTRVEQMISGMYGSGSQPKESKQAPQKIYRSHTRTEDKQVFSFRGKKADVKEWIAYCKAVSIFSDLTKDDICSMAMKEYIENHELSSEQENLFDKIK